MENNSSNPARASARDFFLHLGVMVTLYATAISFLNLLFKIINGVFPEVNRNIYVWGAGSQISLPVATLIVAFPLFLIIGRFVTKTYEEDPSKKELSVRKWLIYITLFITGIAFAGDLVTVIYKFLDGQDLTAAFLLKALSVLLVSGAVFGSCLQDLRDRMSSKSKMAWTLAPSLLLLATIIIGFSVFGSPRTQRLLRYDSQKISDLQNIQWQVINYWQMNGTIPNSLAEIKTANPNAELASDPQTKDNYEYRGTGTMTFELCAQFNRESPSEQNRYDSYAIPTLYGKGDYLQNYDWSHGAGHACFPRAIDPIVYPTQIRG